MVELMTKIRWLMTFRIVTALTAVRTSERRCWKI